MRQRFERLGVSLRVQTPRGSYPAPFSRTIGFDGSGTGSPSTLPIERFGVGDPTAIGMFLERWSALARELSRASTDYIVGTVAEIFENGLSHAQSPVGVLACGQYYRKPDDLELSVVDLGIGIPGNLAAAFDRREEDIDPARALAWAFERGHSSIATSRGLGLALLRGFIRRSGGRLVIASGRALARVEGTMLNVKSLTNRFPGTLVDVTLPRGGEVRVPSRGEDLF